MDLREKFKLKVYQSEGQQYQNLFVDVMTYRDVGFQAVKAHGNIGDQGNDGWVNSSGEYYQVYAPAELFASKRAASAKILSDYQKLKSYWNDISEIRSFNFVVNDKFRGVPPQVSKVLKELENSEGVVARSFTSSDLERVLFELPHDKICSVLGVSPEPQGSQQEDRQRVRGFLDKLSFVFKELFESGREAGYFFPSSVFFFVAEEFSDDWQTTRLFASDTGLRSHQVNVINQLVEMHNQVAADSHYQCIGNSFKYVPPHQLKGRDNLIENKKNSMERFIQEMASSYKVLRDFAV